MLTIIFEAHSTSFDNEAKQASGWNDVDLSELGLSQSSDLGQRYSENLPEVVFCSDLQRSYKTAAIAFKNTGVPIVVDGRLRECDYGRLTQAAKAEVDREKARRIDQPFPDGESYSDTSRRMKAFLDDLRQTHDGKTVMIIGHRATQYGLEEHVLGKDLTEVVTAPWSWQPGWQYELG